MRAIDRLKAAVSMKPQRKSVPLPNGEDLEYWMTPLTLAERAKAQKQAKSDDATDFALQLLVNKATDESGSKMFAPGDVPELRNDLPSELVEALLLQLLSSDAEEDEEVVNADPKPSPKTSRKTSS